jgi:Fungal trichothecene efflux pump (TRI12)
VLTLFIAGLAGVNFSALTAFSYVCQQLFGPDPAHVARLIIASGFAVILGTILVNFGISFVRANRELFIVASCFMTAGLGALAAVTQNTSSLAIGLSFLGGLGVGGIIQPAATILIIVSPDELITTITAVAIAVRLVGSGIGNAVFPNVFLHKLDQVLSENIEAAVTTAGLPSDQITTFLSAFLGNNETALDQFTPNVLLAAEEASKVSYVAGFRMMYFVSIAFGGAAVVASLFLQNIKRDI